MNHARRVAYGYKNVKNIGSGLNSHHSSSSPTGNSDLQGYASSSTNKAMKFCYICKEDLEIKCAKKMFRSYGLGFNRQDEVSTESSIRICKDCEFKQMTDAIREEMAPVIREKKEKLQEQTQITASLRENIHNLEQSLDKTDKRLANVKKNQFFKAEKLDSSLNIQAEINQSLRSQIKDLRSIQKRTEEKKERAEIASEVAEQEFESVRLKTNELQDKFREQSRIIDQLVLKLNNLLNVSEINEVICHTCNTQVKKQTQSILSNKSRFSERNATTKKCCLGCFL